MDVTTESKYTLANLSITRSWSFLHFSVSGEMPSIILFTIATNISFTWTRLTSPLISSIVDGSFKSPHLSKNSLMGPMVMVSVSKVSGSVPKVTVTICWVAVFTVSGFTFSVFSHLILYLVLYNSTASCNILISADTVLTSLSCKAAQLRLITTLIGSLIASLFLNVNIFLNRFHLSGVSWGSFHFPNGSYIASATMASNSAVNTSLILSFNSPAKRPKYSTNFSPIFFLASSISAHLRRMSSSVAVRFTSKQSYDCFIFIVVGILNLSSGKGSLNASSGSPFTSV